MNQVCKIEVYLEDKDQRLALHELMWEQRKILNRTINMMYEWSGFSSAYKEEHGTYPKLKEVPILKKNDINEDKEGSYNTINGYIMATIAKEYPMGYASNRDSAILSAIKKFKNDAKEMYQGLRSLAYYRQNGNLLLHNKCIEIIKDEDAYVIMMCLFSNDYKKDNNLRSCRLLFNTVGLKKDKSVRTIVDRVIEGDYKLTESQLRYDKRKKKFYLYMGYSFEEEKIRTEGGIMGVDLGVVYAMYIAIHGSKKRYKIHGGEIEARRKQIRNRQYSLRNQLNVTGRTGKGRGFLLKNITKIGDKEARFRDTTNHKYSRYLIDIARRNNIKEIRLEKLDNIGDNIKALRNWPYYDLQTKITNKAKKYGINVIYVDSYYTSQVCSTCGFCSKENIQMDKSFKCQDCGQYFKDEDYNAALNIANPDFKVEVEQAGSAASK